MLHTELYQMYFDIKLKRTFIISIQQRMTRILTSNISMPLTATKLLGEYVLFSIRFK